MRRGHGFVRFEGYSIAQLLTLPRSTSNDQDGRSEDSATSPPRSEADDTLQCLGNGIVGGTLVRPNRARAVTAVVARCCWPAAEPAGGDRRAIEA